MRLNPKKRYLGLSLLLVTLSSTVAIAQESVDPQDAPVVQEPTSVGETTQTAEESTQDLQPVPVEEAGADQPLVVVSNEHSGFEQQQEVERVDIFATDYKLDLTISVGGIPWSSYPTDDRGPAFPFYGRVSAGLMISNYFYFINISATTSNAIAWSGGLAISFNSLATGLWAETTWEIGANLEVIGSISAGWGIFGIGYQHDVAGGMEGAKGLLLFARIPLGLFF